MKRKTVASVALGALAVAGLVLGTLMAAALAASPADAGGWKHRGHGGHGYYRSGSSFSLRFVVPLGRSYYGGHSYYGPSTRVYRRYDSYPRYAPPPVTYAPPPVTYAPPAPRVAATDRAYCREYSGSVVVNGQAVATYGTACLQQDGSWKIVD